MLVHQRVVLIHHTIKSKRPHHFRKDIPVLISLLSFGRGKKQCHANVSKNNKKYHMLSYTMVVSFITMNIGIWCIYYHILSYTIIYYHIISYNIIYNIIYYHILTCPSFPSQYQISYQGRPIYILSGASCSFLGQLPWKSLKAGPTWAYGHMEAEPMMGISRD